MASAPAVQASAAPAGPALDPSLFSSEALFGNSFQTSRPRPDSARLPASTGVKAEMKRHRDLKPADFVVPEPVPLDSVGAYDASAPFSAGLFSDSGTFPWLADDMQALFASSVGPGLDGAKQETVSSSDRSGEHEAFTVDTGSHPSCKLDNRLENIRRANREAQKRWRQRNKGRVKLQQHQIDVQQQELNEAKQEARQAKAELQAALQALDMFQMNNSDGSAQISDVVKSRRIGDAKKNSPRPERALRTLGDQVRCKVEELDRLRCSTPCQASDVFNLADDISDMLHSSSSVPTVVTTVDGRPIMSTVWPDDGCSPCFWQWAEVSAQYEEMWSGRQFQSGSLSMSISGEHQQISIGSIMNAPFEDVMAMKDQYICSIKPLIDAAGSVPNSPAGLRAQQLSREACVLTFYACFLSPKKTCRASAFDYVAKRASRSDDSAVWLAVMEAAAPSAEQYQGMRRLYEVFQARMESLQRTRAKLCAHISALASAQDIKHSEYARIFASIQALQHTVAVEQKLRHEVTMLCCSNFTAYQVAMAMVIAYPRFLDPLSILESYTRYQPSSIRRK